MIRRRSIFSLLFAATLLACSGDWALGDDAAPKQPLPTQSDSPGAERVPWSSAQGVDPGIVHAFTEADAGDAGGDGGP
jgi:hypothetical protein